MVWFDLDCDCDGFRLARSPVKQFHLFYAPLPEVPIHFFTHETVTQMKQPQSQPLVQLEKLSAMIKDRRGDKPLRSIADEIKVSAPTLSRVEKGNIPDLDTFMKLCDWLEVSPDEFRGNATLLEQTETAFSPADRICATLRADRTLPRETADALTIVIRSAYTAAKHQAQSSRK